MAQQEKPEVLTLNEKVLYFLVAFAIATSILSAAENVGRFGLSDGAWRSGWLQNFSTEMMGAIAAFILFELIVTTRQRLRDKEENTAQLDALRQAVTQESAAQLEVLREAVTEAVTEEMRRIQQVNAIARLHAAKKASSGTRQPIIDEMRSLDLLQGSDLQKANLHGADLEEANLQGANLTSENLKKANLAGADLQEVSLRDANLQDAYLYGANLQGASLRSANLQNTDLRLANLQEADLRNANLQSTDLRLANLQGATLWDVDLKGAKLEDVNLQGAYLFGANLQNANLADAKLDESTVLPDDQFSKNSFWASDTDMTRFTDPDHPNFWRSDDPRSPAYRGDQP